MRPVRTLLAAATLSVLCLTGGAYAGAHSVEVPKAGELADTFTPWLTNVISQHMTAAGHLFEMDPDVLTTLTAGHARAIFNHLGKIEGTPLTLIGTHTLGNHVGTLLFTGTTDRGPFAIKISYYRFGTDTKIGRIEIVDTWTEIEAMTLTVDPLNTPVEIALTTATTNPND